MLFKYQVALRADLLTSVWRILQISRARVVTLVIAAPIVVISTSMGEARESVNLTIYGAGASQCAAWLSGRHMLSATGTPSPLAWEQMGWVLGYLTAFGQHALPSGVVPPRGLVVAAELDTYCAEHPDELLAIATFQVATLVVERQLQTARQK